MNEWKVSMGRATLFPASPSSFSDISGLQLFHKVWGEDPDNFQKQENPLLPSFAQGRRSGVLFGCAVHPSRLDFNFGPAPPPQAPDPSKITVQLIENARQLRRGLLDLFDALGEGHISDEVARVALNLQMLVVMPDFLEANRAILGVIPSNYGLQLADEEDVVFQINTPYVSKRVQNAKMNAVTRWSVARLQVMTFSVPAGGVISPSMGSALGNAQIKNYIAASVTFDANSTPQEEQASSADQSLLFREALAWVEQRQTELGLIVEGLRNV